MLQQLRAHNISVIHERAVRAYYLEWGHTKSSEYDEIIDDLKDKSRSKCFPFTLVLL